MPKGVVLSCVVSLAAVLVMFATGCGVTRGSQSANHGDLKVSNSSFVDLPRWPDNAAINVAIAPQLEPYLANPYFSSFSEQAIQNQVDVNGDGMVDLIVSEDLLLVVLLWDGNMYQTPFIYVASPAKYGTETRVRFADWTGDDSAEIVFELIGHTGGSGFSELYGESHIIYCDMSCHSVWDGVTWRYGRDRTIPGTDGMMLEQRDFQHYEQDAEFYLDATLTGFAVDSMSTGGEFEVGSVPAIAGVTVVTTTLTTYQWQDGRFEIVNAAVVNPMQQITPVSSLSARGNPGATAEIISLTEFPNSIQACQLHVNGLPVEPVFACKLHFTQVSWQDMTGDGQQEILVTTIASNGSDDILDLETPVAEDCLFQQALVFALDGAAAQLLVELKGCIIRSDLLGVVIVDVEDDGIMEIQVARHLFLPDFWSCFLWSPCWIDPAYGVTLYRWDGRSYQVVGGMSIPAQP